MRLGNKLLLLVLAVLAVGVATLVTVEASVGNSPAELYNCGDGNFTFAIFDNPDPVRPESWLGYTVAVVANPASFNVTGNHTVFLQWDPSLENGTIFPPLGWVCIPELNGTFCAGDLLVDGMGFNTSALTIAEATGLLASILTPSSSACNSSNAGFAYTEVESVIFEDGFESGNTSAWSNTVGGI